MDKTSARIPRFDAPEQRGFLIKNQEIKFVKNLIFLLTLVLAFSLDTAQGKSGSPKSGKNILDDIPYQPGPKSRDITQVEEAFSKHPMLAGAIVGVIKSTRRCELFQYSLERRSKNERLSTQFNGGELKAEFVYFCFNKAKSERSEADDADAGPEMADVVLTIRGDFSRTRIQIMDPAISYSRCYGHYCGSN